MQDRCLTDPQRVRRTWTDGDNVGVGCRASGVVGLDLDVVGDGQAVLAARCARRRRLARHPDRADTGPGDCTCTSGSPTAARSPRASSGGRTALGPGIDVRGPGRRSGGYPSPRLNRQRPALRHHPGHGDPAAAHLARGPIQRRKTMVQIRVMGDEPDRVTSVLEVLLPLVRSCEALAVGDPAELGMRVRAARGVRVDGPRPGRAGAGGAAWLTGRQLAAQWAERDRREDELWRIPEGARPRRTAASTSRAGLARS